MSSRTSRRPHSTPTPVGPHILWPEKARKSAPISWTSQAAWGTYWQASTHTSAPAAWAASARWRTGVRVPVTLEAAVRASSLAPSSRRSSSDEVQLGVLGERDPADLEPALGRQDLPRHDVGVMLQHGEHDGVPVAQVGTAPRARHQVDRLGGVLGEHDLGGVVAADEPGHVTPNRLHGVGRTLGELVDAPMNVGVDRLVEPRHGVDHALGLLGRRSRVEERQAVPLDALVQHRELGSQAVGIQRVVLQVEDVAHVPAAANVCHGFHSISPCWTVESRCDAPSWSRRSSFQERNRSWVAPDGPVPVPLPSGKSR